MTSVRALRLLSMVGLLTALGPSLGCYMLFDAASGFAQCGTNGWAFEEDADGDIPIDRVYGNCACLRGVRDCNSHVEDVICDYSVFDCMPPEEAAARMCPTASGRLPPRDVGGPLAFDGRHVISGQGCWRVTVNVRSANAQNLILDVNTMATDDNLVWASEVQEATTEHQSIEVNNTYAGEVLEDNVRDVLFTFCTGEAEAPDEVAVQIRDASGLRSNPHCSILTQQVDTSQ